MSAGQIIRPAVSQDLPWHTRKASENRSDVVSCQIRNGRLQVIEWESKPIGFIKSCVLWETLPFMELIEIDEDKRGLGLGTQAVRLWEAELRSQGFDLALISTSAADPAQHFWRKAAYNDCGALTVRNKPAEIFMQRQLTAPGLTT